MADNYCKCKGCRHIDPNERNGYKWYCTWYRTYEDPDFVHECAHFENQNSSGGCFLTSACCQHKGLPDDCAELTALRAFRDGHLKQSEEGRRLVEEYYRIAPAIVEKLGTHPNREAIYDDVFATIHGIIDLIHSGAFDDAVSCYRDMVARVEAVVNCQTQD